MDAFLQSIADYLISLSPSSPKIMAVLSVLFTIGFIAKIIRSAIESIVAGTESQADDLKLKSFEDSRLGKILFFVMDLLFRLKKPDVKK